MESRDLIQKLLPVTCHNSVVVDDHYPSLSSTFLEAQNIWNKRCESAAVTTSCYELLTNDSSSFCGFDFPRSMALNVMETWTGRDTKVGELGDYQQTTMSTHQY